MSDQTRRDVLKIAGLTAASGLLPMAPPAPRRPRQMTQPPIAKADEESHQAVGLPLVLREDSAQRLLQGGRRLRTDRRRSAEREGWTVAKEFGLTCSMGYANAGNIPNGLNNPVHHDTIVNGLTATFPKAKAAGVPNLICFFGNRGTIRDAEGIKNSIACLNRVKSAAEEHGVTVCVELLNSKVNHKDYAGDNTPYGVEIVAAVNSPRVKLLYDIYHMQIMEGDVIRTIQTYKDHIAHYHTGGVPGRNELDVTQELNWPAITEAIIATGFTGYMAHEFIPKRDPITSLREAITLCDV